MDNREKFRALHREFGLEKVLSDSNSVRSYLKDMGFQKKEITFLRTICASENRHLKKRILNTEFDEDVVVDIIAEDTGYDKSFVSSIVKDLRVVLNPDFILSIGKRLVIPDAKYRSIRGRQGGFYKEQYQISAYMLRIGADRGALVYPGNLNDWGNALRFSGDGGSFGIAHCSADPFDRKSRDSFISFVRGNCS